MDIWPYKNTDQLQWGDDVDKLSPVLLRTIDSWVDVARRFTNNPNVKYHVNVGYADEGHVENSQHYLGKASDGYLYTDKGGPLHLDLQFITAMIAGFTGIGLYPEWHTPGLHTDVRDLAQYQTRKLWVQRSKIYVPFVMSEWNRMVMDEWNKTLNI